jgi:hypothetical protein
MSKSEWRVVGLQSLQLANEDRSDETEAATKLDASLSVARPYLGDERVDLCIKHLDISTQKAKESMLEASLAMAALHQTSQERRLRTGGCEWKKEVAKAAMIPVREHVLWRTAGYKVGMMARAPMEAAWKICESHAHFDENGVSQLHNARLKNLTKIAKAEDDKNKDRADEKKMFEEEFAKAEEQKKLDKAAEEQKKLDQEKPEGWLWLPDPQFIEYDCDLLMTSTTTVTVTTTTVRPRRER